MKVHLPIATVDENIEVSVIYRPVKDLPKPIGPQKMTKASDYTIILRDAKSKTAIEMNRMTLRYIDQLVTSSLSI